MKTKQVFTLGVILLILAVAVIIKQQQQPAQLATQMYSKLKLQFDKEKVARIDIARFDKETGEEAGFTEFYKDGEFWRGSALWHARVNEDKLMAFLDEILKAKGELRGKKKALFPDFGITDEESYRILLEDKNEKALLDFRISNKKTKNRSIFVRIKGSEEVFLTDADLFGKMGIFGDPKEESPNQMHWASTQILTFDPKKVNRLETRRYDDAGAETLTTSVTNTSGEWTYVREGRPFEIDAEKVSKFLESLMTWNSQAVADPEDPQHGLDKPTYRLTLGFDGSEDITLTGGQPHEPSRSFPMKPSNEPVVYPLTVFYYENMDIDDSRFFKDDPFNVEAVENVQDILIRTDGADAVFSPAAENWNSLNEYVEQNLKSFRVERMVYDAKEAKGIKNPSKFGFDLTLVGAETPITLNVGKAVDEAEREYSAQLADGTAAFILNKSSYRRLFQELDKLEVKEPVKDPEDEENPAIP